MGHIKRYNVYVVKHLFRAGCKSLPAVKPASEEEWYDYFSDA